MSPLRRANLAALALLGLGLLQLTGYLTGSRALRGLGAASCASPLPKVFTAHRGYETFASTFTLVYEQGGRTVRQPLTAEAFARLAGPYNRRNVYGAALSYGPLLPRELLAPIVTYALRPGGPLQTELGLPADAAGIRVEVRTQTRGKEGTWVLTSTG